MVYCPVFDSMNAKNPRNMGSLRTGIAGKKGFCSINIEKDMMNSEIDFGRRVLQAFEDYGISFEHVPSGRQNLLCPCSQQHHHRCGKSGF